MYQKRLKKERKQRQQIQDQLEMELKRRQKIEEALKQSGAPSEILRIVTGKFSMGTIMVLIDWSLKLFTVQITS